MTDILDTSEAPLARTPARFFFETGYFAAYAEASIKAGNRPPFDLTDAIVDRAWKIAPEAHPDRAEFDRYLSSANSADAQLAEAEATYRAFDEANREADGSREGLAVAASSLRVYGADLFPANRAGQVHFARVLMDSAASVIEAALAVQPAPAAQGRPMVADCGIAMVEVTATDRAELERGLITHGFPAGRAKELAEDQAPNDAALQMLARHRLFHISPAGINNSVEDLAARMADRDGLNWSETCGYETDRDECESDTCVAAHFEDHDPEWARSFYRRYARVALGIPEPKPVRCPDASTTQRFNVGDFVSHNAGMIDAESKRRITSVLGYERNGGVQYRLELPTGRDQGMAYDCELDAWPDDDAALPMASPRNAEAG